MIKRALAHTQVRDPRESAAACFFGLATKNHLSLHRHPEMSLEVVEETLLILQESQYYSLLELVDAVPRWMFSGPDLLQGFLIRPFAIGKINSPCLEISPLSH